MVRTSAAVGMAVALCTISLAGNALGQTVECGTASAAWNVPQGAAAFNQGANGGPVGAVINTINEHWTHSAISNGIDSSGTSWGTMNTMYTPPTQSSCSTPVNPTQLGNGWPGARTDNEGGLWTYYYLNGGESDFQYAMPSGANLTATTCMQAWYKNTTAGCSGDCTEGKGYSTYAYMSLASAGTTSAGANMSTGLTVTGGTMCSGNLAFMYGDSTSSSGAWCTPDYLTTKTYPNTASNPLVSNAGVNLWYSVYDECENQTGSSFWSSVGSFLCSIIGDNVCQNAANQVVNCFGYNESGNCSNNSPNWYASSPYFGGSQATTISPARVAADYGNTDSANNSPYVGAPMTPVAFNSGGSMYGCWY
jgi:hypothetical protein